MDLSQKRLLIRVLTWQVYCVRVVRGVFELLGQLLNLSLLVIKLFVQSHHLVCELGHFRDLLADDSELSLTFLQLKVDHSNLLLLLADLLLSILEDVLLNV